MDYKIVTVTSKDEYINNLYPYNTPNKFRVHLDHTLSFGGPTECALSKFTYLHAFDNVWGENRTIYLSYDVSEPNNETEGVQASNTNVVNTTRIPAGNYQLQKK